MKIRDFLQILKTEPQFYSLYFLSCKYFYLCAIINIIEFDVSLFGKSVKIRHGPATVALTIPMYATDFCREGSDEDEEKSGYRTKSLKGVCLRGRTPLQLT